MDIYIKSHCPINIYQKISEQLRKKGYKSFIDYTIGKIITDAPIEVVEEIYTGFKDCINFLRLISLTTNIIYSFLQP